MTLSKYLLTLLAVVVVACSLRATDVPKKPNILLIYADDQSYKTLGCYPESYPWVKTPQIDALAKGGVRFTGAYLGGWCMPSRASILTGRQPHGIQSMRMEGDYPGSVYDPKQCPFWPAIFRKNGYHTAQIGKWHTGVDSGYGRDWDYQIVWNRPKYPKNAGAYYEKQILEFNGEVKEQEGYPADNYTKWAVDYINGKTRDKDKPWFLWLCHGSVHGPSKPAARHKGLYKDAKVPEPSDLLGPWPGKPEYLKNTLAWGKDKQGKIGALKSGAKVGDDAGELGTGFADWVRQVNECVPAVDESVGEVMAALKASGQLENTLVIYTADQGFAMGEHGLRMKIAPYDAAYRSPLIVSMPGLVPAGKVCKQTANAPDLIATFFAQSGIKPPDSLHGRDLTPLLKDPAAKWTHPCLYEHTGHDYGDDVAKVLKDHPKEAIYQKVPWYTAVVYEGWKYIHYLQPGVPEELYDLNNDPEELKNVIDDAKNAERLTRLRTAMTEELKRTQAPEAMLPKSSVSTADPVYFGSSAKTGTSAAVKVDNVALAHTTQLLPLDEKGQIVARGKAPEQIERLFSNLDLALRKIDSSLERVVKLNVYVTRNETVAEVEKALVKRFKTTARPAASFVLTALPHADALVAADAVAVSSSKDTTAKRVRSAALLPPGSRVYISGQAEKGKDLAEATRNTLQSLQATLDHLGLKRDAVVQAKAFLVPMKDVETARKELAAFFGDSVPPLAFVEWESTLPIEIELVVAAGKETEGEVIEFITPPRVTASPIYSRVTRINRGPTIYVSGLVGGKTDTPTAEVESTFAVLGRWLEDADSDWRHLAKATYYVATDDVSKQLNEFRPKLYDPKRPPAASKARVSGVGRAGRALTLDMIAVPAPNRPLNEYGPPEIGHGLKAKQVEEGWISLFDGSTDFGWKGARVEKGRLSGGETTASFGSGELAGELTTGGTIEYGGKSREVKAGGFRFPDTGESGPIKLGKDVVVKSLLYRPRGLNDLFNGKDLKGWKRIDRETIPAEKRPTWKVEKGVLRVTGGPGAIEYEGGEFGEGMIQLSVRSISRYSNGGLFLRSISGDFMNGYEAQLHNRCELRDPGKPSVYSTGGIDDRQNARRLVSRDGEAFVMTVHARGPHLAVWVNGYQVADWTDTRAKHMNPRQGLRLEAGTIQLQAHDPATDYELLWIRATDVKQR